MKNIFICFLLSVIILDAFAQKISSTSFNETVLAENFNVEGSYFPIMVNEDNYFVLDKGDYLLSRNNQQTEYAIIAKTKTLTDFILKTKIKIAPSKNKLSSIGVLFKTQLNATGAIIVEINGDGEYRIKQLIDSTYKIISNKEGANGWKYNKVINKENSYNILEVRCNDNIYELYINNMYLDSFFIAEYNNGLCGLIINPETKARIAYYYIKAKG
ncbi:MAG: hypothetical protein VX370_00295 [Bacteroidota bacterium]|nr:hypothetical protein [Bacteroidota bacterium]